MKRFTFIAAILFATIASAANIVLPAGTAVAYQTFASGNNYAAAPAGTRIKGIATEPGLAGYTHTAMLIGLHDVTISNVVFDGDGILIRDCTNITVNDVWVMNARRGSNNHQAIVGNGNKGLHFNRVHVFNATWAVAQNPSDAEWIDCTVEKVDYGWQWSGNQTFTRCRAIHDLGMGWEGLTNNPMTWTLTDCSYDNADRFDNDASNGGPRMAFSLPNASGTITVTRCFADGLAWVLNADRSPHLVNGTQERRQSTGSWAGVRVGFEVGGINAFLKDCWERYINDTGAVPATAPGHGLQVINCLATQPCNEVFDFESGNQAQRKAFAAGSNGVPNTGDPNTATNWIWPMNGSPPYDGGWSLAGLHPPGSVPPTTQPIPPTTQPTPPVVQPPKFSGTINFDSGSGKIAGTMTTQP